MQLIRMLNVYIIYMEKCDLKVYVNLNDHCYVTKYVAEIYITHVFP